MVRIICSMLTWAGYNPQTHVETEAGGVADAGVNAGADVDAGDAAVEAESDEETEN